MKFDHPKFFTDDKGNLFLNFGEYGHSIDVAAFSKDGKRLLTVREVGVAEIFDVENQVPLGRIQPHSPLEGDREAAPMGGEFMVFIESADLNHDGSLALLGLNDGTAGVYRVAARERISLLTKDDQPLAFGVIRAVTFSHDGKNLAVGFGSRTVKVWDGEGKNLLAVLNPKDADRIYGSAFVRDTMVSSLAFSPDNTHLFAGHADGTAIVWDLKTRQPVFEAFEYVEHIKGISYAGGVLRWCTSGGTVWQASPGEEPHRLFRTGENWAEVVFAGDGTAFMGRHANGSISLWHLDGTSTNLVEPQDDLWGWPDKAKTMGFSKDKAVRFFPRGRSHLCVETGTDRHVISTSARTIRASFSPDEQLIATEVGADFLELWETATGKSLVQFESGGSVGAFAFSHDGTMLAIGEIGHGGDKYPRVIRVWSVQNRELLYQLGGHRWQIHDLAFRSDDQMLVSVADEVRFWTLGPRKWLSWSGSKRRATCTRVLPIRRNAYKTEVVSFPDGQMLLVHASSAELWKPNLERISRFDIPEEFRRHWEVDVEEGILFVEMWEGICAFDIYTGELLQAYTLPISFPDSPLNEEMIKQFQPAASGSLWRGPGGPYIHVGDGPRGWVTPLRLSGDGRFLLIPGVKKAAVVDVSGESKVVGTFPFNGQLRDSCILEDRVLAVNAEGRVFRWENLELAPDKDQSS